MVLHSLRSLIRRLVSGPATPPPVAGFPARVGLKDGPDITVDILPRGVRIGATLPAGVAKSDPADDGYAAFTASLTHFPTSAQGVLLGLRYRDAEGVETTRQVSINDVYTDRYAYISAYCHERMDDRTFRLDRILYIFDIDGVIHDDPVAYLRDELGIILPDTVITRPWKPKEPEPRRKRPGEALREKSRDQMTILLAVGRSDQRLVKAELGVIVDYCLRRADAAGLGYTPEDQQALHNYLKRLFPTPYIIDTLIDDIETIVPAEERAMFLTAVDAIVSADGKITPEEEEIRETLREMLEDA